MTDLRRRQLAEMRHRSIGAGFRRGTWSGSGPSTEQLRAEAKARAEAREKTELVPRAGTAALHLLGLAGIAAGSFYAGRRIGTWWKTKKAREAAQAVHGIDAGNRYLDGMHVLACT